MSINDHEDDLTDGRSDCGKAEAEEREREREQCIELLKAILKMDPNESITPREVLTHPFITTDYLK